MWFRARKNRTSPKMKSQSVSTRYLSIACSENHLQIFRSAKNRHAIFANFDRNILANPQRKNYFEFDFNESLLRKKLKSAIFNLALDSEKKSVQTLKNRQSCVFFFLIYRFRKNRCTETDSWFSVEGGYPQRFHFVPEKIRMQFRSRKSRKPALLRTFRFQDLARSARLDHAVHNP